MTFEEAAATLEALQVAVDSVTTFVELERVLEMFEMA